MGEADHIREKDYKKKIEYSKIFIIHKETENIFNNIIGMDINCKLEKDIEISLSLLLYITIHVTFIIQMNNNKKLGNNPEIWGKDKGVSKKFDKTFFIDTTNKKYLDHNNNNNIKIKDIENLLFHNDNSNFLFIDYFIHR